jgi:mono/diheme cytochrome c family protein
VGEVQDKYYEINGEKSTMKVILATLGISALLVVLAAFAVIYSGTFNVAATVEDAPPLRWMFVTVRESSIKFHARDIQAPPVADAEHLANGFKIYREDCVMCHTPAGRQPSPVALGLNPQAPTFAENDMTVAQLFWVAKNGIRFTGMPAWGPSRSDQDLWDAVSFVMTLPKMSAADYDALDHRTPPRQPMKAGGADLGNGAGQGPAESSPSESTRQTSP